MAEWQIGFCCGTDCENRSVLNQISLSFVFQICAQSTTRGLVPLSATTRTISINFLNTKTSFIYFFNSWCWYSKRHDAVKLFPSGEALKIQVRSLHYPVQSSTIANNPHLGQIENRTRMDTVLFGLTWDCQQRITQYILLGQIEVCPKISYREIYLSHVPTVWM